MDNKALFSLTYGVFMLATKSGDTMNGCITNTCIQVANSPTRVSVAVLNTNYTCDLIKESGVFTASLLDQTCTFETIKHFGFQSGRDVDKFKEIKPQFDESGLPYLGWQTCAVLSCKVVDSVELGSHTLFIAEVTDAKVLSDQAPLTYADYHSKVKPKPEQKDETKKIVGWRCKICKYVYEGSELPADFTCPLCGHGPDDFEPIYEK
jgi:flavin reductase (DIM6/NTAB) family NADH-FMN oxidoreductase RutF/rubredoxin